MKKLTLPPRRHGHALLTRICRYLFVCAQALIRKIIEIPDARAPCSSQTNCSVLVRMEETPGNPSRNGADTYRHASKTCIFGRCITRASADPAKICLKLQYLSPISIQGLLPKFPWRQRRGTKTLAKAHLAVSTGMSLTVSMNNIEFGSRLGAGFGISLNASDSRH